MEAISIVPGTRIVELARVAEPKITTPTQIKVKILEIGICGTDREQVMGGRANAPTGSNCLILGHEMFGQVVETGEQVTRAEKGDLGVFTVRRGCGHCAPCLNGRSDMCYTGNYKERGIKGLHGYDAEYVVEEEEYFVKVPEEMRPIGVLTEPMSVAEKAIDEALRIQVSRLPALSEEEWVKGRTALVAGLGAIGLMAVIALRLRGFNVIGLDVVDEDSFKPTLVKKLGAKYVDSRNLKITDLDETFGQIDYIFEATGVAEVGFQLIDALGINGIYTMTGIPHGERPVCILGAQLISQMVLKNQIILGSVNASAVHFQNAVETLRQAREKWGSTIDEIVTARIPHVSFKSALEMRGENDIKTVLTWSKHLRKSKKKFKDEKLQDRL